jgi:hypothetical protein
MMPATKKRFQISFFQSYWKKGILEGKQTAQTCRNEEEIPKDLFPNNNNIGTISPISGPAIYQGHGCRNHSNMIQ